MKIQIIEVSPTKNKQLLELEGEYEKRLRPFTKLETLVLHGSKSDDRSRSQQEEKKLFDDKLDKSAFIIALDERGKEFTSEEFAKLLQKHRDTGTEKIQILLGGAHGLHPDILAGASLNLSFSKMTFTHEMIRVFLKEQLYRAFMILAGKSYHK